MCGLTGYYSSNRREASAGVLVQMAKAISHRGPDDLGTWVHSTMGIGLAHRRLSILDLSLAGHQPMHSASGRYVIVFNGEIYNHLGLREDLAKLGAAPPWRGQSDTETLLAAFESWGLEGTLARLVGMFAIAVWDQQCASLTLARDRLGEKPLYYGWQGTNENSAFLFGSELKALKGNPCFDGKINRSAISLFLRYNYIPAPYSIYERIFKLLPGHFIVLCSKHFEHHILPEQEPYWSLVDVAHTASNSPWQGSDNEASDELDSLLSHTVGQQMIADVPLGAFLSGGIDSSTIVALMQAQSSRPVKTFSIGFNDEGFNEALHAKRVANHLGTDHSELYVTPTDALGVIPRLPTLYDEPFSDPSQIPTYLVAQLAKQSVTVSLSGDAGDELFCGYNRYLMTNAWWRKIRSIPKPLRRIASTLIATTSPHHWNHLARHLPALNRYPHFGDKLHKSTAVLMADSITALHEELVSNWANPADVVLQGVEQTLPTNSLGPNFLRLDGIQQMMALDTITYLPDDILVKVDRAAMGVSLETRMPFLDHRVVEFAWRLPQSLKLRNGVGKWILRQVLQRYVPEHLVNRPKMGFGVPIGSWLRGPLKDWAECLLDESRLAREGYFNPRPIRIKWSEHLSGDRNWQQPLWNILMFQAWLERQ